MLVKAPVRFLPDSPDGQSESVRPRAELNYHLLPEVIRNNDTSPVCPARMDNGLFQSMYRYAM